MKKELVLPLGLSVIAIVVFAILCVVAIGLLQAVDFGEPQVWLEDPDKEAILYYSVGDDVEFTSSFGNGGFGEQGPSFDIPKGWYVETHSGSNEGKSKYAFHSVVPQEGEISGIHVVPARGSFYFFNAFSIILNEYEQRFDIDLDSLEETTIEIELEGRAVEAPLYSYSWDDNSTWRALYFLDTNGLEEYGNVYIMEVTVNYQTEPERDAAIAEVEAIVNSLR